jgi:hypothetical protein
VRRGRRAGFILSWGLGLAACAQDRILPAESTCGDGFQGGSEECDVDSPGCVECRIVAGWTCDAVGCRPICGDGRLVGNEQCDPPNRLTCDDSCQASTALAHCNLSGYVAVRQTDFSRDTIVGQVQTANGWYFYRLDQSGETFQVEEALYCGFQVTGTVTVQLARAGLRGLLRASQQTAEHPHGPHRGTFREVPGGCALTLDRWYLLRGLDQRFLPADFSTRPPLSALRPLPYEETPLAPTGAHTDGAIDIDGDGLPGLTLSLSGNLSGRRVVVQRDWFEYSTERTGAVADGAIEFDVESIFDNEESVLAVADCPESACPLLLAGSVPARDLPGRATFRWLGPSLDDPRVAAFARATPGLDDDQDLATCERVREALPPDLGTE